MELCSQQVNQPWVSISVNLMAATRRLTWGSLVLFEIKKIALFFGLDTFTINQEILTGEGIYLCKLVTQISINYKLSLYKQVLEMRMGNSQCVPHPSKSESFHL